MIFGRNHKTLLRIEGQKFLKSLRGQLIFSELFFINQSEVIVSKIPVFCQTVDFLFLFWNSCDINFRFVQIVFSNRRCSSFFFFCAVKVKSCSLGRKPPVVFQRTCSPSSSEIFFSSCQSCLII